MSFIKTYNKHKNKYWGTSLGTAFCNMFFTGPYLHDHQQKLYNEQDDAKAAKMIVSLYNDLNEGFNGEIYDCTTKTRASTGNGIRKKPTGGEHT